MKFTNFLSVVRPAQVRNPYWGQLERLIMLIAVHDKFPDLRVAYILDPDHLDPEKDRAVFELFVKAAQVGAFLQRMIDGEPLKSADQLGALTHVVDVSTASPPTTGPKMHAVLAYAAALRTDEKFAQLGPSELPDSGEAAESPTAQTNK